MAKNILLTGATGLIGKQLIPYLQARGYQISILTRKTTEIPNVKVFIWDVDKKEIDKNALNGIDTIIHLAGESIAGKRWSDERKKEIVASRVESANLLYETIRATNASVKNFISAAAVGIYGNRADEILTENSEPGKDFLANCCLKWEQAANQGIELGIRVVKIRIGVILSKSGGALSSMAKPIQFFVGAPLGTGKQWVPWIHLDDIIKIFVKAVEDDRMFGPYNACSTYPVTNKTLTKSIARHLHRPVWPINIPEFAIKCILGEMATVALSSTNASSQKLLDTGYKFTYLNLDEALTSIYNE